jgi:hypothetical protein
MFRIVCIAFALSVAAVAGTIINTATESATETFRISH